MPMQIGGVAYHAFCTEPRAMDIPRGSLSEGLSAFWHFHELSLQMIRNLQGNAEQGDHHLQLHLDRSESVVSTSTAEEAALLSTERSS